MKDNPYEAIKVIDNWNLCFKLGSAVECISRASKKDKEKTVEDLQKAIHYIQMKIDELSCVEENNDAEKICDCGELCLLEVWRNTDKYVYEKLQDRKNYCQKKEKKCIE